MDQSNKPATVDAYLNKLPPAQKKLLQQLGKLIKATAPGVDELISYSMPGYKYKGAPLVYMAAFTNHCSLFGIKKANLKIFEKELAPFYTSGTTIRFTPEQPLPATLVEKIIRLRMQQNEELAAAKAARKKKIAVKVK